jgi:P-type Cu+ transporter
MHTSSLSCCPKNEKDQTSETENLALACDEAKTHFFLSTLLSLPLIFASTLPPLALLLLASLFIFWQALPFYRLGFQKNAPLNMFSLISTGILAAYLYSFILLFSNKNETLYFNSIAMITSLVWLGQYIENKALFKAAKSAEILFKSQPLFAFRIQNEKEETIDLKEVKEGDILRVPPGNTIPVDGFVLEGESSVDESIMTGESTPLEKIKGSFLKGGSTNLQGTLIMQTTSTGENSYFAKIQKIVESAKATKAPITRLADTISRFFTLTVFAIALLTFFTWAFCIPGFSLSQALLCAISVLIIACPCALGLATPLAISFSFRLFSEAGVLVKNASVCEKLEKISILLFDKTGTLTSGKPEVSAFISHLPAEEIQTTLYPLIYSVLRLSLHPYAKAAVHFIQNKILSTPLTCQNFTELAGKGLQGIVSHKKVQIGAKKWLLPTEQALGEESLVVVIDNEYVGYFVIKEKILESTENAFLEFHKMPFFLAMLTGDAKKRAEIVAKHLRLHHIHANLLPEEKVALVEAYSQKGKVAMIGDGVNDAPALMKSYVSCAMGTGSDFAMKQADMVLIKEDLGAFIDAYKIAKKSMRIIRQNLFFAFTYNVVGILFATGLFYPFFGVFLHPVMASIAMILSSLSILANTSRLYKS